MAKEPKIDEISIDQELTKSSTYIGTKDNKDVLSNLLKQLDPQMKDIESQFDKLGIKDDWKTFVARNDEVLKSGTESKVDLAISFSDYYNAEKSFITIDDVDGHPAIMPSEVKDDLAVINTERQEKGFEINAVDHDKFEITSENHTLGEIEKNADGKFEFVPSDEYKDDFEKSRDTLNKIEDTLGSAKVSFDENDSNITDDSKKGIEAINSTVNVDSFIKPIVTSDFIDNHSNISVANVPINVDELKQAYSDLKDKASAIEDKIDRAHTSDFASHRNVFKQYNNLSLMVTAHKEGIPLNGKYVTKGEIFIAGLNFYNGLSLDSLLTSYIELKIYQKLDGIENYKQLELYHENGYVDKSLNNDIDKGSIDNVEQPITETENHNEEVADAKNPEIDKDTKQENPTNDDKIENNNESFKLGDFELDKNSKFDKKEGFSNSDGSKIGIEDLKSVKIGGADLVSARKDGSADLNILRSSKNENLIDGKLVVPVKGWLDKTVKLDTISTSNKESMTIEKRDGSKGIIGVDRPATVGYVVYDPTTNDTEYRNCKFEHIGGTNFDINKQEVRFFADQINIQGSDNNHGIDNEIVKIFDEILVEKISLDDKTIDNKINEIDEKISDLETLRDRDNIDLKDSEKDEINATIEKLQNDKDILTADKDDLDKTAVKYEICNSELPTTKVESDHQDEVDKIKMEQAKDDISKAENKIERNADNQSVADAKSDLIASRNEYIEKSNLSDKDKDTLSKATCADVKDFDTKISNAEFDDKEKVASVVKEIYGNAIDKSNPSDFKSEICVETKASIQEEKDRIEKVKVQEIEAIKSDFKNEEIKPLTKEDVLKLENDSRFERTDSDNKTVLMDRENQESYQINKTDDGKLDSVVYATIEDVKSETDQEYHVIKTEVTTFNEDEKAVSVEKHGRVGSENFETEKYEIELDKNDIDSDDIPADIDPSSENVSYNDSDDVSDTEDDNFDNVVDNNYGIINAGIDKAIEDIKNDTSIENQNKGDVVAGYIEDNRDRIADCFKDKAVTSDGVAKVTTSALHSLDIDYTKKNASIRGFINNNLEKAIDNGFEGKDLNGRQLSKDSELKIACENIDKSTDVESTKIEIDNEPVLSEQPMDVQVDVNSDEPNNAVVDNGTFEETVNGIDKTSEDSIVMDNANDSDSFDYENLWDNISGDVIEDKIDTMCNMLTEIFNDINVDSGSIMLQVDIDNLANDIYGVNGTIDINPYEENGADDLKNSIEALREKEYTVNTEYGPMVIKGDEIADRLIDKIENAENAPIVDIERITPKIETFAYIETTPSTLQDEMAAAFVDGAFESTEDFLGAFLSTSDEENQIIADGKEYPYNKGFDDCPCIDARINQSIEAIARYADANPDKIGKTADAILTIAKDTGCISQTIEKFEDKLSDESKSEIMDRVYSRIDDIIDSVYGVDRDRDNNDVEITVSDDRVEEAQNEIINVVSGVVDVMLPQDDDIKQAIMDKLEDTKTTIEEKQSFLDRVTNAVSGITDSLKDYTSGKIDKDAFIDDIKEIELNAESEYDSVMEAVEDYEYIEKDDVWDPNDVEYNEQDSLD